MSATALVLLAAGNSSRMGSPKQLLLYNGKPLIRHAAETALASVCRPVFIVLGAGAEAIRPALEGLDVRLIENEDWAAGMGASIRAGVSAAEDADIEGLVLALADQPLITAEILNRLVLTREASGLPIVASQYAETAGVPVYFAREFFPQLLALKPDQGCKGLILSNAAKTIRIPCPEAQADVDTPDDYNSLSGVTGNSRIRFPVA